MATGDTYFDGDGKSVEVTLSYTVAKDKVAYVEGWLGIANNDGDSDDLITLSIDMRSYNFEVPTALAVSKGDTVWVDITDTTGHYLDGTGYAKAASSNLIRLFRAEADQDTDDMVRGVLLGGLGLS